MGKGSSELLPYPIYEGQAKTAGGGGGVTVG